MADVLNRTTKQYLKSVNTPDYPEADWIINPDLTAVAGQPVKYWKISGDDVLLMDQSEQDAVDAQKLSDQKDNVINEVDDFSLIKALALVLLDEVNILRTSAGLQERTVDQLKTAMKGKL